MSSPHLSCNLDKIALVRNARDHFGPDVTAAARACLLAGAHGITLHPRSDRRHALFEDIRAVMSLMADMVTAREINQKVEMNIEGDLRPDLLDFVAEMIPQQFTIVPVNAGEKTSERGWGVQDDHHALTETVRRLGKKTRLSLFIWGDVASVEMAAKFGLAAVEFYTGPYALAEADLRRVQLLGHQSDIEAAQLALEKELTKLSEAASRARQLGLRINAGHDLTLENLSLLVRHLQPDEVSIGHALVSEAFLLGLPEAVKRFLSVA